MHNNIKTKTTSLMVLLVSVFLLSALAGVQFVGKVSAAGMWSKTYGGTGTDNGWGETVQTSDGGFAIAGDTNSSGAGGYDFWLIKTDADGNMQWNKTYGGALNEQCGVMCQTSDGGYAMAGATSSFGAGAQDFWLVKTDASGNMQWSKTYGGIGNEGVLAVVQTSDGGYALAGNTSSFGAGIDDFWLVKTDASGNMLWNKTYGGIGNDGAYGLVQTSEGGYTMAGYTHSFGAGGDDVWLVKTDTNGNMQWNKTFGGTGTEWAVYLVQSSDGGYAIPGYTTSAGGGFRAYLVKTDASGNLQWNKTYAGTGEVAHHAIQTADGGYALAGFKMTAGVGFLLIKTDADGNMQWNQTYPATTTMTDAAYSVIQSDGGYALTGNTKSFGAGGYDIYFIKTDGVGVFPEGLTIGVMMLLSAVAVIVSLRYFRKRPKIRNLNQVKL
jgi:predicted secreted protein